MQQYLMKSRTSMTPTFSVARWKGRKASSKLFKGKGGQLFDGSRKHGCRGLLTQSSRIAPFWAAWVFRYHDDRSVLYFHQAVCYVPLKLPAELRTHPARPLPTINMHAPVLLASLARAGPT